MFSAQPTDIPDSTILDRVSNVREQVRRRSPRRRERPV